MPHTVASSRKQPLFSLINVSVILNNTLVYSFLLAQGSVRCCLVVSPTSASRGYAAVAVLVLPTYSGKSKFSHSKKSLKKKKEIAQIKQLRNEATARELRWLGVTTEPKESTS